MLEVQISKVIFQRLCWYKLDPSENISDGDIDASVGGGQAPENPEQDQEIHTALSGRLILFIQILYL